MSPEANEGKPDLETSKQLLEEFLTDAEVGTPKFMAFYDRIDLIDARMEMRLKPQNMSTLLKVGLVEQQISMRKSEIPEYDSFFTLYVYELIEDVSRESQTAGLSEEENLDYHKNLRERLLAS